MQYIILDDIRKTLPRATSYDMFKEMNGHQRVDFCNEMIKAYGEAGVRGAAANQLGSNYRVLVMSTDDNQTLTMFGPRLTAFSTEKINGKESSATWPGFEIEVDRPPLIRVTYHDINGVVQVRRFVDDEARVFLHYFDHLEGRKFWGTPNRFHLERAERKWKNSKKKNRKI